MEYIYTDKDGNQTKFTDDMVRAALDERAQLRIDLEREQQIAQGLRSKNLDIRQNVFEFFNERYTSGDEEIVCSVKDINELLEYIGADKLKSLWTISGRIEFTITDIEAESEEEARDVVESNLTLEYDGGIVDDYSIDITDADEQ